MCLYVIHSFLNVHGGQVVDRIIRLGHGNSIKNAKPRHHTVENLIQANNPDCMRGERLIM